VGSATVGQYENIATVTGTPPAGPDVTDTDLSHYFGAAPAVDIEKLTNGEDADTSTGPLIETGSNVLWIYRVTNTGNVLLPTWTVSDDQGVSVACPSIPLRPNDTATCFATGTAEPGQYTNIGTVDASDPAGTAVSDSDPSNYFGVDPSIQVKKSTNGVDADTPTGPYVPVGDTVTWEYVITNTGNVSLTDLDLFDTQLGPITCTLPATLDPGDSATCTASGTATAGQYTNTAFVSGVDPLDRRVVDDDPSHYFGADPGIVVEKATNGIDGDEPIAPDGSLNGPYILVGEQVVWSYRVTNTGNETITSIALSDDQLGTIVCPRTTLNPGESMDCDDQTGTAQRTDAGAYVNLATVTGNAQGDGQPTPVIDTDPSHYWGYEPGVAIEKSTNGEDADTPTGPAVAVGDPVQWSYEVTNTGNVSIVAFTVTDSDPDVSVSCPPIGLLLPGESVTCEASGTARAGEYTNTATVDALDFFEDEVSDTDPSHYFGEQPAIVMEKSTNGIDADLAPGPDITEGELVTWSYVVTNTGNVDLVELVVTDNRIGTIPCPSTTLAVGATVTCTAQGAAAIGQYANVGTATAITTTTGTPVTDTDPSHYNGKLASVPPQPPTTLPQPPTTLPQPPTTLPPTPTVPPGGNLPATGSDGPQTFLMVGLLAAVAGLVLLMTRRAGRNRHTT
jgi:LPXTG-motif cell wall-anchored protein